MHLHLTKDTGRSRVVPQVLGTAGVVLPAPPQGRGWRFESGLEIEARQWRPCKAADRLASYSVTTLIAVFTFLRCLVCAKTAMWPRPAVLSANSTI